MELVLIIIGIAILGFLISMAFNKFSSKPSLSQSKNFRSTSVSSQNSSNQIVIETLDGGKLIFSEDGVAYISDKKNIFIKKSEIVSFNYEKLSDDVYRIKIASKFEVIDTTVKKEDLKKLFMPATPQSTSKVSPALGGMPQTPTPTFSWLGPLLGFGTGMLAGSLLDDLFSGAHAAPHIESVPSQVETSEHSSEEPHLESESGEDTGDLDVDAAGFGIDSQDVSYDEFSQDLDTASFDEDDLSFPDDNDLV
jgi:hypothetical protein